MQRSDVVFHLVSMQERSIRESEAASEKANRRNSGKSDRERWGHIAAHHASEAAALALAIKALVDP